MLPTLWFTPRFARAVEEMGTGSNGGFLSVAFSSSHELLAALKKEGPKPDVSLIDFDGDLRLDYEETAGDFSKFIWFFDPLSPPVVALAFEKILNRGEMDFVSTPLQLQSQELRLRIGKILSQKQRLLTSFANFLDTLEDDLSGKELRILRLFSNARDQSLSRDELMQAFWNKKPVHPKTLDVQIFNLRKKLEKVNMEIRFRPETRVWQFVSRTVGISEAKGGLWSNDLSAIPSIHVSRK